MPIDPIDSIRLQFHMQVRVHPRGVSQFVWSDGYGLLSFPVEEIDPTPVPDTAFDGKDCVGTADTPVASGQLHPQIHNLSAGVLDNTRSDLQAPLPVLIIPHLRPVGGEIVNALRNRIVHVVVGRKPAMTSSTLPAFRAALVSSRRSLRFALSGTSARRAAKDGARSSRLYGDEGVLTHPSYQGVCERHGMEGLDVTPRGLVVFPASGLDGSVKAGSTISPSRGRAGSCTSFATGGSACGCGRCVGGPSITASTGSDWSA